MVGNIWCLFFYTWDCFGQYSEISLKNLKHSDWDFINAKYGLSMRQIKILFLYRSSVSFYPILTFVGYFKKIFFHTCWILKNFEFMSFFDYFLAVLTLGIIILYCCRMKFQGQRMITKMRFYLFNFWRFMQVL